MWYSAPQQILRWQVKPQLLVIKQLIQIQTSDLLANLFHFEHGEMAYSLDPDRFESVPQLNHCQATGCQALV